MSYALKFTDRALARFQQMEIWLQEETLDELDRLAADPPLPARHLAGAAVHDFVRDKGRQRFYVFITVIPERTTRTLRISEVGWHISRAP